MGVKLIWQVPDSESTFDKVYIYRSDSETGTYTEIANQDISDNTYYDMNGTSSHWYKVRFFDSSNNIWSDYSDPIQGSFYGAYCSIDEVKEIADIPSNITDIELFKLIRVASMRLNMDIQTRVFKEKVDFISDVKENELDGSNTTFYTKFYPIGDYNNDFRVTVDDITVYREYTDNDGERQEETVTVSSIDPSTGKFVLASAPDATDELFVTYCYTPKHHPVHDPSMAIKMAVAYLASFLAKAKVGDVGVKRYTIDRLTVMNLDEEILGDQKRYQDLVELIRADKMLNVIETEDVEA